MNLRTSLAGAVAASLVIIGGILMLGAPVAPKLSAIRGVKLMPQPPFHEPRTFDPRQSAALFIGVRKFTRDADALEVPFAADDAVDLAYAFALDRRTALVSPLRVVLALSG